MGSDSQALSAAGVGDFASESLFKHQWRKSKRFRNNRGHCGGL
jgi:hypothetical protein